jgi:hypothetical protein
MTQFDRFGALISECFAKEERPYDRCVLLSASCRCEPETAGLRPSRLYREVAHLALESVHDLTQQVERQKQTIIQLRERIQRDIQSKDLEHDR